LKEVFKVAVPDFQSMMLPALRLASRGEINSKAIVLAVAQEFKLSDEDLTELLPGGSQTRATNRAAWAIVYLQRAALIERVKRGVYTITNRGREFLEKNPVKIGIADLRQFQEFRGFLSKSEDDHDGPSVSNEAPTSKRTPLEGLELAERTLLENLKADLIDRILVSSPEFFEKMVVRLLTGMFRSETAEEAAGHLGKPGDGGVDGVIRLDALGIDRVYIQAKRYGRDSKVGRPDLQSFSGSLDDKQTTRGVFITTSSFSEKAKQYVKRIAKQIVLIDGNRLV
jgi:restriction system protein